jgi:hypothetical protein
MKSKASAIAIAVVLFLLTVCLAPITVQASNLVLSPTEGVVGTEVTVFSLCNYGTGDYIFYWEDSKMVLKQGTEVGCSAATFTIPEASRGKHKIILEIEGVDYNADFTVLPVISLGTDSGTVGSELTVTGKGFNTNEKGIEILYDGVMLQSDITADSNGNWQSKVNIPQGPAGDHAVDARGTTPATEVEDMIFTVNPKVTIDPASGGVGTMVTIGGSGFRGGETGITVTYDGLAVKTGIGSNDKGFWRSNFYIPSSTKGRHTVDAYGDNTADVEVENTVFTVSPSIRLEMASGYLGSPLHIGDNLWISGIGFEENEVGIQVIFDGTMIASGINADAKGSWAAQLQTPLSSAGEHTIDASGATTQASDIADVVLIISPQIEIDPTTGNIGDEVVISGTGFDKSQSLTINFDGIQVASGAKTDAKGSFKNNFKVPAIQSGDHTITVADTTAFVASIKFTVESIPPPTPKLLSPETGTRHGFMGRTILAFDWEAVDDPSGVSYKLELSQNSDFSGSIIRKESLILPQYTLTEEEALEKGSYYWRVKAIDGAGNEGEWTNGQLFKAGLMEWWYILIIVAAAIVVIAIIWRVIVVTRK